jgi:hypothetical protein
MQARSLLTQILEDEALTRGLADPEARVLVEWLVEGAEQLAEETSCAEYADRQVRKLCRRGRAISCFVRLWCHEEERGAAGQLAVAERFHWPLPATAVDPCELMQEILEWETRAMEDGKARTEGGFYSA